MIKIPEEILSASELCDAIGRKEKDIDIEITGLSIEKSGLVLVIDTKLNFMMPRNLESLMKQRIVAKLGGISKVRVNYMYTGIQIQQAAREEASSDYSGGGWSGGNGNSGGGQYRRRAKDEPVHENAAGELILMGKDFNGVPADFKDLPELVGTNERPVIEGEVFKIESMPIRNDRTLITILIAAKARTFCIKQFVTNAKFEELESNLSEGDMIRAKGPVEYDTFEHENILKAQSIKKVEKKLKEDTYPGGRRVELHCHSKMSDNDGFNEVEDIVNTAAYWGQPAVAITDHGVVQGFPDAAKAAGKLAKKGKNIKIIYGVEGYLYPDEDAWLEDGTIDIKKHRTYHIILLAKNQTGLKNIYKLVSKSHIDYFYKRPRLPRSVIEEHREGLIIGSACEAGELYQAVLRGADDDELLKIASYYDYLEIQPLGNNRFMVDEGIVQSNDDIIAMNKKIIEIGDRLGKLTVATTDSHYPTPEASIYRNIIMAGIGFRDTMSDSLYLRTTDEMMKEFEYLGDRAEEIVVTNTNKIADMVGDVLPVPKGKFPPRIEGAEDQLRNSCYEKAKSIYGDPLPPNIEERLETELSSIIGNGYAVMYIAAQMLVHKSNSDGYLVGSRGSVGSSFAATMAGITEVNPLPPHYVCPKCKHYEESTELDKYDTGYDMPEKSCPECGTRMKKEGLNIPFATFLGFKGDKEPDIDLNFAGEYQPVAHRYVGEIFGEKNVFKAGTVATIADKTAFGYVKHYIEDNHINANKYDIDYLVKGCTGVKRTTGQHPGGIIVVPDDHEIYEFCPIQKPANKRDTDVITTHFDYHKIDENLLKLDILGHDVPQLIRHLQVMTGVDPMTIPLDDKKTLSIFTSLDELHIKNPDYKFTHGTYAIPEFGTNFTRNMLDDIHPTTVSALIKMSGFSHGTDVWTNNAQDLLRNGTATIDEVISCRDDIMNFLIAKGLPNGDAFKIMEIVRKNRVLSEEQLQMMKDHGVPDWYIWSCETLKYMFPRAHAAAYVMMSIRMAWFKVNYPEAFYAAWFSSKVDNFDAESIGKGIPEIERRMEEIEKLGNTATAKQKEHLTVYEVMYEMLSRGYEFAEPVLGVAEACRFSVVDGKVMLPFNAVNGIGDTAAESLTEAFKERPFNTLDDVRSRTRLSGTNIDDLKRHGLFAGLPESAQMSIFDFA
ncbi:MAG: PolC-type DNA polymerase III [Mogibacterium sp.]|nr:PolC-type DNA polymerase III [Mogibacterium sp.]MBR2541133.1 PolC-type DNA polymerase III [Mogibacterium sp.]